MEQHLILSYFFMYGLYVIRHSSPREASAVLTDWTHELSTDVTCFVNLHGICNRVDNYQTLPRRVHYGSRKPGQGVSLPDMMQKQLVIKAMWCSRSFYCLRFGIRGARQIGKVSGILHCSLAPCEPFQYSQVSFPQLLDRYNLYSTWHPSCSGCLNGKLPAAASAQHRTCLPSSLPATA